MISFNESNLLEIRDATEVPEHDLRRHLLSLCTQRIKILDKRSKTKSISEDDVFTFNEEFTSKHRKMR